MESRSDSRGSHAVRVLAVHTTEGTSYTAEQLRDASWWTGSSHAIADPHTLLTPDQGCVPYGRASWTLRSGNPWSENIELVALASWTRADWIARPSLLDLCAWWLALRSNATGVPLVKLTPEQYRAGASGVIGHHDHTVGYNDGTHWDPGPDFPWDTVLNAARIYTGGATSRGFLMALNDAQQADVYNKVAAMADTLGSLNAYLNLNGEGDKVLRATYNAAVQSRDLAGTATAAALAAGDVDEEAIAAALAPLVASSTSRLSDEDLQRVAAAVADEQYRRQES